MSQLEFEKQIVELEGKITELRNIEQMAASIWFPRSHVWKTKLISLRNKLTAN